MVTDIDIVDVKEINRVIKELYHVDFSKFAYTSYRRRIIYVCNKLHQHTVSMLLTSIKNPAFFEIFCKELVVDVTEMFRDPSFWRKLKDELKQRYQHASKIKIWVAGCSSGEELLSLLILLKEIDLFDKAKIVATEINELAIHSAKELKYSVKSMETAISNYERLEAKTPFTNYYKEVNGAVVFDKSLLQNVVFKPLLLGTPCFIDKFDFILCRNVLIYFNQSTQSSILGQFTENLLSGGKLVLGIQETMQGARTENLFSVLNAEEKIYIKR